VRTADDDGLLCSMVDNLVHVLASTWGLYSAFLCHLTTTTLPPQILIFACWEDKQITKFKNGYIYIKFKCLAGCVSLLRCHGLTAYECMVIINY
jgi:hypothetical protein